MSEDRKSRAEMDMQERSALLVELQSYLSTQKGTQAEKAKRLGLTQPRLNDLLRGRVEKFSLDALTTIASRAGLQVSFKIRQPRPLESHSGPKVTESGHRNFSPFPVSASELGRLDPTQATLAFRQLLICEAFAAGVSPKNVVVPSTITKSDGGIDAKITGLNSTKSLLLPPGNNHYQIKTGETFKPWQPSSLKKELFGEQKKPTLNNLGSAIRECLDSGGNYVIATFGHDLQPKQHTDAVKELTNLLGLCGYDSPSVDVIGQGQIAGELEKYPSLCFSLFGLADDQIYTLDDWKAESLMQSTLHLGDRQKEVIEDIRKALLEDDYQYVRVSGEPGIGKTRTVLEATSHDSLAPTVVYVPTGDDFQKSRLFKELIRTDRKYAITVVIDDCEDADRISIWSSLKGKSGTKLITIDHGPARDNDAALKAITFPELPNAQILEILTEYVGKNQNLETWAEVCSGSPRVAHAVGENLKNHVEDVLQPPATVPLWERYLEGNKADKNELNQYNVVLQHVALFKKFGYEAPVSNEARFIASLIEKVDPTITWGRFQTIIQHFRSRRILQGNHTLFLVPKALHIFLWRNFWDAQGRDLDFPKFLQELPPTMRDWFFSMFIYAEQSPVAKTIVKSILSPTGPFEDESFLTSESGTWFINYLAEADPESTLSLIERSFGSWSQQRLLNWRTGRQYIVWALEKIAVWHELFQRAAMVLVKMATAESASNSNNSKGTLVSLFKVGFGWAATQAPPELRYQILKELVTSQDRTNLELGLELATSWLSTYGGYRTIGPEHQGLKPTIEFWKPAYYGEIYEAWKQVWKLLASEMSGCTVEVRQLFADTLVKSARGLIKIESLSSEVMDTLYSIAEDRVLDRKELTHFVISYLRREPDEKNESIRSKITELNDKLVGSSLWDRIERYVLHSNWDEDYIYSNGEITECAKSEIHVKEIANKVMKDISTFADMLPRLLNTSGHRLPSLGVECGFLADSQQHDMTVFETVGNNLDSCCGEFLGGYLNGIKQNNSTRWEHFILNLLKSESSLNLGIECIWRSGLSENVMKLITKLFVDGTLSTKAFGRFYWRLQPQQISEPTLISFVESLLSQANDDTAAIVIPLVYEYFSSKKEIRTIPKDLAFRVLTCEVSENSRRDTMHSHYWCKLADHYISAYPDQQLRLLEALLTIFSKFAIFSERSDIEKISEKIVKNNPDEAWLIISRLLDSSSTNSVDICHWLGGPIFEDRRECGPIQYFPPEDIISWVKVNPDERIWKISIALPKKLDSDASLTARFIEEFADDNSVARHIQSVFYTGGWSGPESAYLEKKRNDARRWLGQSQSLKVRLWLDRYIDELTQQIESARIKEERGF